MCLTIYDFYTEQRLEKRSTFQKKKLEKNLKKKLKSYKFKTKYKGELGYIICARISMK